MTTYRFCNADNSAIEENDNGRTRSIPVDPKNADYHGLVQSGVTIDPFVAAVRPKMIPLSVIQARLEVEGAWDTYVNHMFAVPARRNAFLKTMFIGHPVDAANGGLRTTMAGAGLTTAQIDRILA